MSSIADLRAFLLTHKLPKMTSKKSVLMEAAIERGWKPSGQALNQRVKDEDEESVDSVPPKNSKKAVAPVSKKAKAVPQKETQRRRKGHSRAVRRPLKKRWYGACLINSSSWCIPKIRNR